MKAIQALTASPTAAAGGALLLAAAMETGKLLVDDSFERELMNHKLTSGQAQLTLNIAANEILRKNFQAIKPHVRSDRSIGVLLGAGEEPHAAATCGQVLVNLGVVQLAPILQEIRPTQLGFLNSTDGHQFLRFSVAHEIAHLENQDDRAMLGARRLQAILEAAPAAAGLAEEVQAAKNHRACEFEERADGRAFELLVAARHPAMEAARGMRILQYMEENWAASAPRGDHPPPADRVRNLELLAVKLAFSGLGHPAR